MERQTLKERCAQHNTATILLCQETARQVEIVQRLTTGGEYTAQCRTVASTQHTVGHGIPCTNQNRSTEINNTTKTSDT